MTAPSTGAVGGAQHRDECPVHQPVDANGKAALRNLYEAFDRVKAEEWRIFVAATGYDPEDPSEDDYGTCVREAVAQVRADERERIAVEVLRAAIEAAHEERRQTVAQQRDNETLTLFQHWSATAGWLAWRIRQIERVGEPDWPDAMRNAAEDARDGDR